MPQFLREPSYERLLPEVTKVVLVHNDWHGSTSDSEKSESQKYDYARNKIDSIQAHKKEIDVSVILDPVSSPGTDKKYPPRVLMDGAPGVGKTTLTLHACKDWANDLKFKQYDLVLFMPLRQASFNSLVDLLPGDDPELKKDVERYINQNSGENVAMIFDGYDELSYDQRRQGSFLMRIFKGEILHKCAVWITSRPYTSGELLSSPGINKHVEVVGFKKEQIYACVRKRIKDRDKANSLLRQLKERDDITSICYIPFLCTIMIRVYESNSDKVLPLTMTELFERFLHDLVQRDRKVVVNSNPDMEDIDNRLSQLGSLAYECLVENKFVFSFKELQAVFGNRLRKVDDVKALSLGLLTSSTNVGRACEQQFQYVHLSIQEYLAATHVSKQEDYDELMNLFCRHIDEPRYRLFLLFLSGMTTSVINKDFLLMAFSSGWKKTQCEAHKSQEKKNQWASRFLYCINLVFESTNFDDFIHLFDSLPDKSKIQLRNYSMSLFECRILARFLCSIKHTWEMLDVENCSLNVDSLEVMKSVCSCVNDNRGSIQHVNFSFNDLTIGDLHKFPWFNNLQVLTFKPCQLNSWQSDLSCLSHIQQLDIKVNHCVAVSASPSEVKVSHATLRGFVKYLNGIRTLSLTDVDRHTVQKALVCCPCVDSLQNLEISDVDSIDQLIIQNAETLISSMCLRKLTLHRVHLSSTTASKLFQFLSSNTSIQELNISGNPLLSSSLEDASLMSLGSTFESFLSDNKTVYKLAMNDKSFSNGLTQYLVAGLSANETLRNLELNKNELTVVTINDIVTATTKHDCLSSLFIGGLKLQRECSHWRALYDVSQGEYVSVSAYCLLKKLNNSLVRYPSIAGVVVTDHDHSDAVSFFNVIQHDKSVRKLLYIDLKFSFGIGCTFETFLTVNNVISSLRFHNCSFSNSILTFLEAGLANNVYLKEISLTNLKEANGIICVLRALQRNESIECLDLSENGSVLNLCCSQSVAIDFKNLFCSNCSLKTVNIARTCMNDTIIHGMAEGLSMNRSLNSLKMSLTELTSRGIKRVLYSATFSALTNIEVCEYFSFNRSDTESRGWDVAVKSYYHSWPYLQHTFQESDDLNGPGIASFEIPKYFSRIYQCERVLNLLSSSKTLLTLNLSCVLPFTFGDSKGFGIALKKVLETCSCLKSLTLKGCELPKDTWMYAASGLGKSPSLKHLEVSGSTISTVDDAVRILNNLNGIEELDISDNVELLDSLTTYNTKKLSEAFTRALTSSSSRLKCLNVKNSINNEVAKMLANTLQNKSLSLKNIELSEDRFSCDVVQMYLMLMVEGQSSLVRLKFSKSQFHQSSKENFMSSIMDEIAKVCTFNLTCPLFGGVCNIILYEDFDYLPSENMTSISLEDINVDCMNVLFHSLCHPRLSKIRSLSLRAKDGVSCIAALGRDLQKMLEENISLRDFTLSNVVSDILPGFSEGLKSNHHILKIVLSVVAIDSVSKKVLANFLKAMDSSKSLYCVCIKGLPPLHRNCKWLIDPYYRNSLPVWLFCSLSTIYRDSTLSSNAARSILMSCSVLKVNSSQLDCDVKDTSTSTVTVLTELFNCLKFNSTLTELDLSENEVLKESSSEELCQAIECMFSENKTLEVLKVPGALNNHIARALITGLTNNQTPRDLHIQATSLKMKLFSKMAHFLEVHSLKSLHVVDVVSIQTSPNFSKWQVIIKNKAVMSVLLSSSVKALPKVKLWSRLWELKEIECISNGTPVEFYDTEVDEGVHYQLPCRSLLHERNMPSDVTEHARDLCRISVLRRENSPNDSSSKKSLLCCEDIKQFLKLKSVGLSGLHLSDDMYRCLLQELSTARCMTKLDLSGSGLDKSRFCEVLQQTSKLNLKELNMSHNNPSHGEDSTLKSAIETFLMNNKSVLILKLGSCSISDSVCTCIGQLLRVEKNISLSILDLSANNITDIGATALVESLKHNMSLKKLDLSGNSLFTCTSLGNALCDFFRVNTALVVLNLVNKLLHADSSNLVMIASSLEVNNTMECLSLPYFQHCLYTLLTYNLCVNVVCACCTLTSTRNARDIEIVCNENVSIGCSEPDHCRQADYDEDSIEVTQSHQISQPQPVTSDESDHCRQADHIEDKIEVTALSYSFPCPKLIKIHVHQMNADLMVNVLDSIQQTITLETLQVLFDDKLSATDSENIGIAIKYLLQRSLALTHLQLLGVLQDDAVKEIITGLESASSIKCIRIEVNHLSVNSIVSLLKAFDDAQIAEICVDKVHEETRGCLIFPINYININKAQDDFRRDSEVELQCIKIDDTLAIALFKFLKVSNCQIKVVKLSSNLKHSDTAVSHSLQEMLTCNKVIKELDLYETENENNSIINAVAEGLTQNRYLQKLTIDLSKTSDDSLYRLLRSLSSKPLTVEVFKESKVCFKRHIDMLSSDHSTRMDNSDRVIKSSDLNRLLSCIITNKLTLRELEIAVFNSHYHSEMPTLCIESICEFVSMSKVENLRLRNTIDAQSFYGLSSCLIVCTSLNHLAITCKLDVENQELLHIQSLIVPSLTCSSLLRLEILGEFIFFRNSSNAKWNIKLFNCATYGLLCYKFLSSDMIQSSIDKIIVKDKDVSRRRLKLPVPDTPHEITYVILRSIEQGCFPVKELHLHFEKNVSDHYGVAIERMLASRSNKYLQILLINNLTNDSTAKHLLDGISGNRTLNQLSIDSKNNWQHKDKQQIQILLRLQDTCFRNSAIWKISLCNGVSIERNFKHELALPGSLEPYVVVPSGDPWVFKSTDKKQLLHNMLNNMLRVSNSEYDVSSSLIFHCLQGIDLSNSDLEYNDLATLFEALQRNDTVKKLDVSYAVQKRPSSLEVYYCMLERLLERNKSLKVLNLTGLVDKKVSEILASQLQRCSLTSLLINFETEEDCSESNERLVCAFMQSKLYYLGIENHCCIHVRREPSYLFKRNFVAIY